MKNNFSLKFNLFDLIIIAISGFIAIASIVFTNIYYDQDSKIVQIQYKNEIIQEIDYESINGSYFYTLKKEDYPDLYDDFVIEINSEKGIRVYEVTCPNNYCKHQGWVKMSGYPIVCVPNGVIICLVSGSQNEFIVG